MMDPKRIADDLAFWKNTRDVTQPVLEQLNQCAKGTPLDQVLQYLCSRVEGTFRVLMTLREHHRVDFAFEGAVLLRCMYDATLQAVYLLHDPALSHQLAADFSAFQEVERQKRLESLKKSTRPFAKRLLQSPTWAQNQPSITAAYDRIKHKFLTSTGRMHRNSYRKNLRDIAMTLGWEEEYDFVVAFLQGAVHSTPSAMRIGPGVRIDLLVFYAWLLWFRVVGAATHYHGVTPPQEVKEWIDLASQSFVDVLEQYRSPSTPSALVPPKHGKTAD